MRPPKVPLHCLGPRRWRASRGVAGIVGGAVLLASCAERSPTAATAVPANVKPTLTLIAPTGPLTAQVGTTLPEITICVTDTTPTPNKANLSFVVTGGGGTVYAPTVATVNTTAYATSVCPSQVIAQNFWTLGTNASQAQTLEVRIIDYGSKATGAENTQATLRATAVAAAAAKLLLAAGDKQTGIAGQSTAVQPTAQVTDKYGNGVAGVPVTFAVGAFGGSISATTVNTDVNGNASVGWALGPKVGTYQLTASGPTGAGLTPTSIAWTATAVAGVVASLAKITADPQTAVVGAMVPAPPQVRAFDVNGNVVPGVTVGFAPGGPAKTTVGNSTAVTDANGIAGVGSWSIGTATGSYTLQASVPSGAAPVNFTVTATAGPPAVIKKVGDGQSATVGSAVQAPPAVLVSDQYGNAIQGAQVTFAIQSGGGSLTGASAATDATGRAGVGSWVLGTTTGTNSLSASTAGIPGPALFNATATAGAGVTMNKLTGDGQTGVVNTALPIVPTVQVFDQYGNVVPGAGVSFAAGQGNPTISPPNVVTDANGKAGLNSWILGSLAGTNTVIASLAANSHVAATFTATGTGPGTALTITNYAGDAQSQAAGTAVSTAPAVQILDANQSPVAGVAVTFSVTSGGGSVTNATAVTNSNGIATVGSWTLGPSPGVNELKASFNTITSRGSTIFVATGT